MKRRKIGDKRKLAAIRKRLVSVEKALTPLRDNPKYQLMGYTSHALNNVRDAVRMVDGGIKLLEGYEHFEDE